MEKRMVYHARPTVSVSDSQMAVWLEEDECALTLFWLRLRNLPKFANMNMIANNWILGFVFFFAIALPSDT